MFRWLTLLHGFQELMSNEFLIGKLPAGLAAPWVWQKTKHQVTIKSLFPDTLYQAHSRSFSNFETQEHFWQEWWRLFGTTSLCILIPSKKRCKKTRCLSLKLHSKMLPCRWFGDIRFSLFATALKKIMKKKITLYKCTVYTCVCACVFIPQTWLTHQHN